MGDMKGRRRLVFDSIERCFRPSVALDLEGRVYLTVHSYTLHSTLNSVHSTLYTIQCTVVQCTVYKYRAISILVRPDSAGKEDRRRSVDCRRPSLSYSLSSQPLHLSSFSLCTRYLRLSRFKVL